MRRQGRVRHVADSKIEPYWRAQVPSRFDVALLKPRSLPRGERFESKADARALSGKHEHVLRRAGGAKDRRLADALSDCRDFGVICGRPACPMCQGYYRRWFMWQALAISKTNIGGKVLTVYLGKFAAGQLGNADLPKLHAAFRARLRRCGFAGGVVVGGTEAQYRTDEDAWLVHVHLLAADVDQDAIENLKKLNRDISGAVMVQTLADPVEQLSYLQKFSTFHRPGKQTSNRRPRAYPLPPGPRLELLRWMAGYHFDDFRFLFGARRRGSRIVRECP